MKSQLVVVVLSICFLASGVSVADVWYVNDDAPPGGSGLAWESAMQTIGAAVTAADVYDEIWVAQGNYPQSSTLELKIGQHLYGGFIGNELDRMSRAAEYYATVGSLSKPWLNTILMVGDSGIDGFVVRDTNRQYPTPSVRTYGEGVTVSNCVFWVENAWSVHVHVGHVTLENCTFQPSGYTGELYVGVQGKATLVRCSFSTGKFRLWYGKAELFNCVFWDSFVEIDHSPNAIFTECCFLDAPRAVACFANESASFVRCLFSSNEGYDYGAGIFARGTSLLNVEDCTFEFNAVVEEGAGISFTDDPYNPRLCQLNVTGSLFSGNSAATGAAIEVNQAWAEIKKCTFRNNYATSLGGCIRSLQSCLMAENCLFTDNVSEGAGGVFYLDSVSELDLINSTIVDCTSAQGAVVQAEHGSQALVNNSIVWSCAPAALAANGIMAGIAATYSCIEGGAPGVGNVDKDPWFADRDNDDFSLLWGSPCVDTGTAEGAPGNDLAGTPRPQLAGFDMGAFEFVITDEDEDGMDDYWETYYGLNPADPADADEDADGDGVTNAQEAAIRNNPQDPDDCRNAYYVATDGNDTEGDGSETDPWATIGKAMAYAGGFSMYKAVNMYAAAGTYNEPVVLAPQIALIGAGQGITRIEYMDVAEDEHYVVTGAEGAALRDCTIEVTGQYSASFALLKLDDLSMEVSNVTFDGDDNLYSLGALISGTGSSETVIDGCTFRRLYFGVQAVNTAANVTNTTFSGIRGDAIFVRLPDVKKNGEAVCTPRLGDAANADTTGNNMFRNVMGNFVLNMNNVTTKAENNDWGVYTDAGIAAKMAGPVDYKPFVGEQADHGDNGGCFAAADKALPMRASRSGADTFIMIGIAACLAAGSRRKKH
ncbi:MAG TPA: right-handed parallel beta-helix repeat-containing protein [Candidatus Bathyarchaeia archaeon]|nr:right-handed parallel beta-helix repeat-containing protein [Candidatus Bathyarchaeia archaeon]